MGLPQRQIEMTMEEFIAWENQQPDKHEFVAGEVFAMSGARRVHVAVTLNVAAKLKEHLRSGPCRAFMTDMKLEVRAADAVFYPDVLVTCHPEDLKAEFVMHHPKVVIEVLSESTAGYDRGGKFSMYRQLESLAEYVLIDTDAHTIEVFRRTESGDWLLMTSERGLLLKSLDFAADLDTVFEDV